MDLTTVKFGPAPVDGVPSGVEGVYLLEEAFGEKRPADLIETLRGAMEEYAAEFAESGEVETWLVTGEIRYVKGELFASFSTVSSMSWSGWIGKDRGYVDHGLQYVCVEDLDNPEEEL